MKTPASLILGLAALSAATSGTWSHATPLNDFNAATLITDFQFDDADGTALEDTLNSADPAAPFDDVDAADFGGAATNGLGQFSATGKANTNFGTAYTDVAGIPSGRVLALYDVEWAFDEQDYDPSQDEEFRLTLVREDPRSTFVTAEIFFRRTSATEVTLFGNGVGTGSSDSPDVLFGSSGSLLTILDVDLDADVFELWYSADNGTSFVSGGTGTIDPTRGIESVRLVLNEDFSNDTLLIDRFAVAFVPEPTATLIAGALCLMMATRGKRQL